MARLTHFVWFKKYRKMDANVAIIASGLETLNILEALNISVYLDKGFQEDI